MAQSHFCYSPCTRGVACERDAALACGGGRREAGRGWGRRNKIKGCGGGEWGEGRKEREGNQTLNALRYEKGI